ncbi:DUF695 domain-containing protein [Dyella silvatica]|uniref:DUF695 domain-containing protein n=1 Tax=Dyella silvatica TaxID=2992128 RepID=UPI00224E5BED|nr:DUF695 domain-containing protein [Dyella silvatica]
MFGILKDDNWLMAETRIDNLPILIRVRQALPAEQDRRPFTDLMIITWPYEITDSGMPSAQTYEQMLRFEKAIEQGIEANGIGVQAASLTGNGHKEWRYFSKNGEEFLSQLNISLDGHPVYPIAIESFLDEEWTAHSELLPQAHGTPPDQVPDSIA